MHCSRRLADGACQNAPGLPLSATFLSGLPVTACTSGGTLENNIALEQQGLRTTALGGTMHQPGKNEECRLV
jgi:hypothetical protein